MKELEPEKYYAALALIRDGQRKYRELDELTSFASKLIFDDEWSEVFTDAFGSTAEPEQCLASHGYTLKEESDNGNEGTE